MNRAVLNKYRNELGKLHRKEYEGGGTQRMVQPFEYALLPVPPGPQVWNSHDIRAGQLDIGII